MDIKLPPKATKFLVFMRQKGFEIYVVGGFVRDSLLDRKADTKGIDFTTSATPPEMLKILPQGRYENRFGTVLFPLKDIAGAVGLKTGEYDEQDVFEVTTFRTESRYTDFRHPDKVVWGKSLSEDLERRDFTVNAMAFDGTVLIDKFGGIKDLKNKMIRTVGNPDKRYTEDALRMMRAIRFASELGFDIEEKTLMAIGRNARLLKNISFERIRDEFLKIIKSDRPSEGVMLLKNTGLLEIFMPELIGTFGVGQASPKRHHIYDVGTHLLNTLAECANPDPIVRLAALIHDIGKPQTRKVTPEGVVTFYNHEIVGTEIAYEIGQRLRLSKKDILRLTKLVRYHQFSVNENQTEKALRRLIRQVGKENLDDILDLRVADRIGSGSRPTSWRLELFKKKLAAAKKKPFTVHDLKINGTDVMKVFGIKPGPRVGDILDQVFQEVSDGNLRNDRESLLGYLQKIKA